MPCQATIINPINLLSTTTINQKNKLLDINKNQLSNFGQKMINKRSKIQPLIFGQTKKSSFLQSHTFFGSNESKTIDNMASSPKNQKFSFTTK